MRNPQYNNFYQWSEWGKGLMDLHINKETVAFYPLQRKAGEIKNQPFNNWMVGHM